MWALHDTHKGPLFWVNSATEADWLQSLGYGIFWTPNVFERRRLCPNVTKLRFWFCELDDESKETQRQKLRQAPLRPSYVVETKRGYHCYWRAKPGADTSKTLWDALVKERIVPAMGGDSGAADIVRVLRVPGYYHLKGEPYLVQTVWNAGVYYSYEQMLRAFPTRIKSVPHHKRGDRKRGGFWTAVSNLDGREAIQRLNGHWLMKGETFWVRENGNGKGNIFKHGGSDTGVFIDEKGDFGNVGSPHPGPSIANWLAWYSWDWSNIAKGLKEVFDELKTIPDNDIGERL